MPNYFSPQTRQRGTIGVIKTAESLTSIPRKASALYPDPHQTFLAQHLKHFTNGIILLKSMFLEIAFRG